MPESRINSRKLTLGQQRSPVQQRSRQRRDAILRATAALLEKVGFDGLTTTLVAREMGISVGSLYHYFPHKQAILYAIGEQWLAAYSGALEELASLPIETLGLEKYVNSAIATLGQVYENQRGVLPLVHAMYAVPELRDLDEQHDVLIISHLDKQFSRLGLSDSKAERERVARLWLEMTHALFVSISTQSGSRARRSRADLSRLCLTLLESHLG